MDFVSESDLFPDHVKDLGFGQHRQYTDNVHKTY